MTLGDRLGVMNEGRIVQVGAPHEVYEFPQSRFVADFIGSTNLIDMDTDSSGRAVALGQAIPGLSAPGGGRAVISVRPEDVHLTAPGTDGTVTGTVTFVRDLGGTIETFIDCAGKQIIAVSTPRSRPEVTVGQPVGVLLDPGVCVVLDR